MSQTTKTSKTRWNDSVPRPGGFTLLELIVVLVILSAMVSVILPYAARSNEGLRVEQECLNIAQAAEYAMSLSADTRRPTRLVLDVKERSYLVEIASESGGWQFVPTEGGYGTGRYLGRNIYVMDVEGFDIEGKGYFLLFDPARAWPQGVISLGTGESLRTIRINGRRVEIEDSTI